MINCSIDIYLNFFILIRWSLWFWRLWKDSEWWQCHSCVCKVVEEWRRLWCMLSSKISLSLHFFYYNLN